MSFRKGVRWLGDGSRSAAGVDWEDFGSCACGAACVLPEFLSYLQVRGLCGRLMREEGGLAG